MASLPLMFGAILAGGVVIDYGVKQTHKSIDSATANVGTGTATAANGGTVSIQPLTGSHANPFANATGLIQKRTDQGVDADMNPGSPINAPFDSQYLGTIGNWFDGQPYIAFQILNGTYAGDVYYLAEQIDPVSFSVGQKIGAGTTIAHYASSGTGIEMGLANPSNWQETLARATSGYSEGEITPAGSQWRAILNQLTNNFFGPDHS